MKDDDLAVPTARECFAEAYRIMRGPGDLESASMWMSMARELREDAQMRRMWAPLPQVAAPDPAPVRTLRDVAAIVCAHGAVAVQWKDGQQVADWWLHVSNGSSCDDPDPAGDMFRRRDQEMRERQDDPALGTMAQGENEPQALETTALLRPYVTDSETRVMAEQVRDRVLRSYVGEPPTAVLPMRLPEPPVEGAEGVCRNHEQDNELIMMDGAWRHRSTMQSLCPIAGQNADGDETFHRFANPL